MSCVNIKHPEFIAQAKRLNISKGQLRNITHEFQNQKGNEESFPSDAYVLSKLQKPNIITSEAQQKIWERRYSTPYTYKLQSEVDAFTAEASKFFNPKAISVKELPSGEFEASVGEPILKSENDAARFDFEKPISLKRKAVAEDLKAIQAKEWNLPENVQKVVEQKLSDYMSKKEGENQQVDVSSYFGREGKTTAADILNYIKNNSTDAEIKELASYLLDHIGNNGNVVVTKTDKVTGPRGQYFSSSHSVKIHQASLTGNTVEEALHNMEQTIIHEISHAVTVRAIEQDAKVRREVLGIYKEYSNLTKQYGIETGYAAKNVKEFVSEFLGRKAFREALMALPSNKDKKLTIGQKILNFLKKAIGIKTDDTFFDRADKAILNVLDMANAKEWEYVEDEYASNAETDEAEHVTQIRELDESISDDGFEELIKQAKEQNFTREQLIDYAKSDLALYDIEYQDNALITSEREEFERLLDKYFNEDITSLVDKTLEEQETVQEEGGKERNIEYQQQSKDLIAQLKELRNSDKATISQSEVRHLAEQCVYWISDRITDYLKDPQKLLDNFGEQLGIATKTPQEIEELKDKISSMSRVEVANLIGAENLKELCRESLFVPSTDANGEDGHNPYIMDDFDLIDQAQLIYDNFDAIIKIASDVFTSVENFSIVANDRGDLEVNTEINTENDNFNKSNESEDVKEEEGSEQEHWQIESRTIDVLGSMSRMVRQGIAQCYVLEDTDEVNEDGTPKYKAKLSNFGVKERVNAKDATNQILRWTQGAITYEDMISKLQGKVKENPWVSQLIDRLIIKKGEANPNTDFQSQFFGVFCKHFQPYSVVIKEDGKYKTIQVNEHPALRDAVNAVTTQYKIGEHPMFTREGVNKEQFSKFSEAVNALKSLITKPDSDKRYKLTEVDKDKVGENIWFAAQCLGHYVTPEMVAQALNSDKALYQMANALEWMATSIETQLDNKNYEPFKFKAEDSISGNLRKFLQPLTDVLEDVAVSSFYDSGKMYQSYVTPSYMTKLMNKFSAEGKEFEKFIQEEYGDYEWFKDPSATDVERGWKNEWLRQLATMSSEDRQKLFKHKVQLNFNKHNYMRNMSDTEYAMSLITEFFSETKADKNGLIPAWYRIPMLSNKPSSEFIQFYRYHGDFTSGNKSLAKQSLVDGFKRIFNQELSRIQTCEMRAEQITDSEAFIKSFDKNGKKFMFLDFLNDYLLNKESNKYDSSLAKLIRQKLDAKEELSEEQESKLNEGVKDIIAQVMDDRATQIVEQWKSQGIFEGAKGISNLVTNTENADAEIENNLREFIWNDAFAAMNIMQLTVTDIAYYKDAEDLQKRLAQIHAPGIRGNVSATDYEGKAVTDGKERTFYLTDFDKVKSNIIENVSIVFDRKLKELEGRPEYAATKALYDSIIDQFNDINVADAQGYSSPTSYRKKAFIFGEWSPASEQTYQNLLKGEFSYRDLQVAFQPRKPFVYSQISKPSNAEGAPIQNMKVGVQNKNSEYLLIMADAILQGQETGRPNLLRAIYRVMEDSIKDDNTKGIDTVQFESTVKAGLMGRLDLKPFMEMEAKAGEDAAYNMMMKAIGNSKEGYSTTYVHEIPFEDYCIQQPVPEHFKNHEQAHGSQIRYIIPSDLESFNYAGEAVTYDFFDPKTNETKRLTAEEFKREYEVNIAENIQESIDNLSKELGINDYYVSAKDRNVALSKILQREILSSPRYGVDLLEACSVNENGEFNIPLGDPIQSKRVEQLINSIIKNRINKQKIAGGPVVQVTNFGTSKELNIRFKDKKGNLLQTRREFQGTDAEFKKYISENQAGIAYFEVFAPVYANELFEKFEDEKGNIDIAAIEKASPDLLKMIGYRIPTEDKYSMAPLKIVGFLPREAGEGIMMPNDITLLTGSDFDVDKMYLMRKEFPKGVGKKSKRVIEKELFKQASESYKKAHDGKANDKFIREQVRMFLDNPEKMRHTDDLMKSLYKTYQSIAYRADAPTEGRAYRNNKIIDMSWAVLTNETTSDKMLNPGGFDEQKRMGYMVEAQRLHPEMPWSELESMKISDLKNLCYTQKNLSFIDTHIQFYKQNSAAGTILGMFAVQKVAHAVLESNGYFMDVTKACKLPDTIARDKDGNPIYDENTGNPIYDVQGFTIAGMAFKGRMEIDRKYNRDGQLIGKTLGSLVASAADAVKDPVLNLMNINSQTANVLNTLIRMGMSFNDASLFLSQKIIANSLAQYNSENITSFSTLTKVMGKKIAELEEKNGFGSEDNKIHTEELTRDELIKGLTSDDPRIQYKTLKSFMYLNEIVKKIKGITFATRFNSISAAVGPLVIDNLIMEHKMDNFSEDSSCIYDGYNPETSNVVDMQAVLAKHPIIEKFSDAAGIAATLFRDMPANSIGFRNVLGKLGKFGEGLVDTVYNDRKLLSQLSDFYQSYMLVASDAISSILKEADIDSKYGTLDYFINKFPADFMKGTRDVTKSVLKDYNDNALVQAIKLDATKEGRAILKVDITGLDTQQKERLSSAWADLHKVNPKLSTMLFLYNYYRTGVAFSPKTFMSLVPTFVKENLTPYVDAYRKFPPTNPENVIDQFIRNNWDNNKLVPRVNFKDVHFTTKKDGTMVLSKEKEVNDYQNSPYLKIKTKEGDILLHQISKTDEMLVYEKMEPLGNNGEYLEISKDAITKAMEKPTTAKEQSTETEVRDQANSEVTTEPSEAETVKQSDRQLKEELISLFQTIKYPTREQAIEKIVEYKQKSIEDKKALESQMKTWLGNRLKALGMEFDAKKVDELYKIMC